MRIGHGYDVHRLSAGRKLILGGVEIAWETHAVMDALLGAAAMGDIGKLFPDTDGRYLGACSLDLLSEVGARLAQAGYRVGNIDATVLAQKPKLAPHIDRMRENLAARLGLDVSRVSVKATTEERLGFTGREEGIAAHAVCLLLETE